ncbi:response regulator [Spirosoma aerophilum]
MKKKAPCILIVEDDPDYAYLIEEALKICRPSPTIHVLQSGTDLLTWLATGQRPSVIFLDLNMPQVNGFEVLKILKTVQPYKTIPVVMLSVSERRDDIVKCYEMGVNAYITKPMTFSQLLPRMEVFSHYWFDVVRTPDSAWQRPNGYSGYN